MGRFKVGDRVGMGNYLGTVTGFCASPGWFAVKWDGADVTAGYAADELRLIAPAPPVTRPIQPGDYIKDPGPRPADAEPLRVGELVYGTESRQVFEVARLPPHGQKQVVYVGDGEYRFLNVLRRLPPDAVLDEARSPRRDGKAAFAEAVRAASCKHDRSCPIDCAKWSDVIAKVNAQDALLNRALILVSGLNLQHHAVTREQFETAQGLCRDLVRVLKAGRHDRED